MKGRCWPLLGFWALPLSLLPSLASWVFGRIAPAPGWCQRQPACLKAEWIISLTFSPCHSSVVVVDFDMHFVDCMVFACSVECRRLGADCNHTDWEMLPVLWAHRSGGSVLPLPQSVSLNCLPQGPSGPQWCGFGNAFTSFFLAQALGSCAAAWEHSQKRLALEGGWQGLEVPWDQPPGAQGKHSSPEVLFQPWEQALLQAQ